MTLEHKNVVRCNDEYFCTACGKSWDVTDREPPACEPQFATESPYNGGFIPPGGFGEQVDVVIQNKDGSVEKTVATLTPTGRSEFNRREEFYANLRQQAWVTPKSVGKTMTLEEAEKRWQEFKEANPHLSVPWQEIEARAVSAATQGWPTPASPLSAWLVYDAEDPKTALLVYAMTGKSAVAFVNQVLKLHGTLESCRCQMMDGEARGFAPYVDANPNNRKKAKKASRRNVVTLLEWRR